MPSGPNYTEEEMQVVREELEEELREWQAPEDKTRIVRVGDVIVGVCYDPGVYCTIYRGSPQWRRETLEAFEDDSREFHPQHYLEKVELGTEDLSAIMDVLLDVLGPLGALAASADSS